MIFTVMRWHGAECVWMPVGSAGTVKTFTTNGREEMRGRPFPSGYFHAGQARQGRTIDPACTWWCQRAACAQANTQRGRGRASTAARGGKKSSSSCNDLLMADAPLLPCGKATLVSGPYRNQFMGRFLA
jgi:hypothetical protein